SRSGQLRSDTKSAFSLESTKSNYSHRARNRGSRRGYSLLSTGSGNWHHTATSSRNHGGAPGLSIPLHRPGMQRSVDGLPGADLRYYARGVSAVRPAESLALSDH